MTDLHAVPIYEESEMSFVNCESFLCQPDMLELQEFSTTSLLGGFATTNLLESSRSNHLHRLCVFLVVALLLIFSHFLLNLMTVER